MTSLQSDTRCQMSNADAARRVLENKMKDQEADLKIENSRKASEIVSLTNEMRQVRSEKDREEIRQYDEKLPSSPNLKHH